ncbi:protein O-mannosyl-transferase TMTC3 [Trichonephila clavipes]|nr:protein O-mannosyl-transferase TMTC3 [Trichonephila clavipes]
MITNFFIPELNNHDVQELWFQQDGAICDTACATIDLLKDTFGDRLISRFGPVNWPPRSCDLTPQDYFLWGYVNSLVYAYKPQTLDHLEDNIRRVIAHIRPQMLEKVIENWTSRLDYIRASRGSHMSEIIFKILERIVDRGKETERVYINLGLVAVENRNFQSAEKCFRKALMKNSSSREALFNLALLVSEQSRGAEALGFLDQLLQHYPGHINGLLLLADVNINYLRNLDKAEECYWKVLQLDPTNQKAHHNICVVHFERQDYEKAEQCFAQLLSIHPNVSYIRHHLDVVRNILKQGQSNVFGHLAVPQSVS